MPPTDIDSTIRVVVTPSQSSYFAGEPFTVTITLTNTRSPNVTPSPGPSSRPAAVGHRRGIHSISSAPLARPPTSPGTPRMAPPPPPPVTSAIRRKGEVKRLGLVGIKEKEKEKEKERDKEDVSELMEQRRKRLLAKSLSVSVDPREVEELQSGEIKSASYAQTSFTVPQSPTTAQQSPLSRTAPFPTNHPHARKHSILDGPFSISPPPAPPPPPKSPLSTSTNGSTSTFTLPLDPISESVQHAYVQSNASFVGPSIEVPNKPFTPPVPATDDAAGANGNNNGNGHVYAYPPPRSPTLPPPSSPPSKHRPAHLQGLGTPANLPPHPNAETILYAYAQLVGTITLTPIPGTLPTPAQESNLRQVRRQLVKKKAVGGGSMDISLSASATSLNSSYGMRRRPGHSRSSSFSSSLMSLISPKGASWNRSVSSGILTLGGGLGSPSTPSFPGSFPNLSAEEDVDSEAPLPTFEVQPEMLGVDLWLLPGESKSYTYTVPLPPNLPPTFRGKAMKLSYELVVGTCRASGPGPGTGGGSVSRVMKVPIRVYNHVSVTKQIKPYDILSATKPSGIKGKIIETPKLPSPPSTNGEEKKEGTLDELKTYANRLLATLPPPPEDEGEGKGKEKGVRIKVPAEAMSGWERGGNAVVPEDGEEEEESEGCREAVEVLTRITKKASYDVTKDGTKVATLTFSKSAYRLGETITGVVEINERRGKARVVKLSATLEAHELLPSTISPPSAARHLRRAHAEHYNSFTLNTLRTTFALDIPSDAAPAFGVVVPDLGSSSIPSTSAPASPGKEALGGLEWKVRLCLLVAVSSPSATPSKEGILFKSLVRDGERGEWGSPFSAPTSLAPLEKPAPASPSESKASNTWSAYFASKLFSGEREYHDGDDLSSLHNSDDGEVGGYDGIIPDPQGGVGAGVDYGGGEEGWREAKMETVECEVPVGVWPGNTVYRSQEVVFDV